MWIKKTFENGIMVEYKSENGSFKIKCDAQKSQLKEGSVLNCLSNDKKHNSKIRIGSFVNSQINYCLEKKYSVSYMLLNGINPESELEFEITDINGNTLFSTKKIIGDKYEIEDENSDFAVRRAKEILDSVVLRPDDISTAARISENTMLMLKSFEIICLDCFREYTWHRITDVSQDFYLSSVSHLIFENDFIFLFQKNREWYFGYCDERLFAVCIASDSPVTPFLNAQDCSTECKNDKSGKYYHAVGVALLDDGQFFYKML